MRRPAFLLLAAAAIAAAAGIEYLPTDSPLYDDLDRLKTSGFIRLMSSTSRPWTRQECLTMLLEAESLVALGTPGPAQRAALERLRFEFGEELQRARFRRPLLVFPVPGQEPLSGRAELFGRAGMTGTRRAVSVGTVLRLRPDDAFALYDRLELEAYSPKQSRVNDPVGWHNPGYRNVAWQDWAMFHMERAYLAFRLPWAIRLEVGRDKMAWGPGYRSSAMLSDSAPALDLVQWNASYRNFKFISFTSMLSKWNNMHPFVSGQRLELSLFNRLTFGGAMFNVFAWDSLQTQDFAGMLNPLLPLYFAQAASSMGDNLLLGADLCLYVPQTRVYGQYLMDNFEFNTTRKAPNAVAWQVGAYWAPNLPVEARIEYANVQAFTYYHRIHHIMYQNWMVPLGHAIGPDADQVWGSVRVIPTGAVTAGIWADYTRRGFYNRGGWERSTFYEGDTVTREFPSRGIDSTGVVFEEVEKALRVGPELQLVFFGYLRVKANAAYRVAEHNEGVPGRRSRGPEYALKVEYRY